MQWLNYHHLLYFWLVAREGGLAGAGAQVRLSPSTLSGQIRLLEQALGEKLFVRRGRGLVLTEMGRVAFRYASEIFSLGQDMQAALAGKTVGRPLTLTIGIADVVPKLVAHRLIAPTLELAEPIHLVCREDKPERLLAALAAHELDVVISDAPAGSSVAVRVFNHVLGECGVTFFATAKLAARHRDRFPASLDGAPVLLPSDHTGIRPALDQWFSTLGVRPDVVCEFDDSALLKVFGQRGVGIFPAPSVISREIQRQYQVVAIGATDDVRERFYAISVERRLKHPAVVAISHGARDKMFRASRLSTR